MVTELSTATKETWLKFVEEIEPLRPDLFRYCLRLTGTPFDAEDLVHDGMLKAFSSMASQDHQLTSPKGFLLKIVSNLWIDSIRRSQLILMGEEIELSSQMIEDGDLRDAVATLISRVNPREQVIIVLSEVFEMTHREIANLLSTTEGAIKVALHRSRVKLKRPALPTRVPKSLVENFVKVFKTHDMDAVKSLLAIDFEADVFPYVAMDVGREHHAKKGWLNGCFYNHILEREAARDPYPLYFEIRELSGEPVVLVFRDHGKGKKLEEVWRFEADEGELTRVRDYGFSPDLVHWVADHFDLPFKQVGYRLHKNSYQD